MYEERAVVLEVTPIKTENYFVSAHKAFEIARESTGLVLVCIGSNRYKFYKGQPFLSIIEKADKEKMIENI